MFLHITSLLYTHTHTDTHTYYHINIFAYYVEEKLPRTEQRHISIEKDRKTYMWVYEYVYVYNILNVYIE